MNERSGGKPQDTIWDDIRIYEPFWGNWYIEGIIGEGSYGSVYRIKRNEFDQEYCAAMKIICIPKNEKELKKILVEGVDENQANQYFKKQAEQICQEIVWMSELKGKTNIVSYEDHQVIPKRNKIGYYVMIRMELLTSLNDYAIDNPITNREVVKMGGDICRALMLCKKHGILHRDIKPDNIFVSDDGDFKLGDFGIARQKGTADLSMSIKGSFEYMAPEVYKGYEYDERVDIYSLGIVLYTFLNNRKTPFLPVFEIADTQERKTAIKKRFSGQMPDPPFFAEEALGQVILKACAFESNERYGSAEEFLQAMEGLSERDLMEKESAVLEKQADFGKIRTSRTQQLNFSDLSDTIEEDVKIWSTDDIEYEFLALEQTLELEDTSEGPEAEEHKGTEKTRMRRLWEKPVFQAAAAIIVFTAVIILVFVLFNRSGTKSVPAEFSPAPTAADTPVLTEAPVTMTAPPTETSAAPYEITLKKDKGLESIKNIELLTGLDAAGKKLEDISLLAECGHLTSLELRENRITDLSPVQNLEKLEYLSLSDNKNLADIKELKGLSKLSMLSLDGNSLKDISALKDLKGLETLNLSNNQIVNIDALSELTKLQFLNISNNEIKDISCIKKIKSLKQLILTGNPISKEQTEDLRLQLPDCDLIN